MRFMTWNINSVRLRIHHLLTLMKTESPEIICLQETKTEDMFFPETQIVDTGYPYIHFHGMKGYNGVAILSKVPFENTYVHHHTGKEDCRHISVQLKKESHGVGDGTLNVHCLYIPAGGYEPDPVQNNKFRHKLEFVEEMTEWFPKTHAANDTVVALGDFNIAPLENDVWSHKQMLNVVSHTEPEIRRLDEMQKALGWIDTARHFIPEKEKCYTWWSYRNRDWKKSNRGRRLDHIWVTQPLKKGLKDHKVLTDVRDWEKTSDHVPVILDLV